MIRILGSFYLKYLLYPWSVPYFGFFFQLSMATSNISQFWTGSKAFRAITAPKQIQTRSYLFPCAISKQAFFSSLIPVDVFDMTLQIGGCAGACGDMALSRHAVPVAIIIFYFRLERLIGRQSDRQITIRMLRQMRFWNIISLNVKCQFNPIIKFDATGIKCLLLSYHLFKSIFLDCYIY